MCGVALIVQHRIVSQESLDGLTEILAPTNDSFELDNTMRFGQCNNDNTTDYPRLYTAVNVSSPLFDFGGSFNMMAWLENVTLSGGFSVLKYDLNAFRRLSLSTLLSDGLYAALPISEFRLFHSNETLENLGVNLSSLLRSNVFNSTYVTFTTNNHEGIPVAAESMLSWALASMEDMINAVAKAALSSSRNGRESSPNESNDYSSILWKSLAIAAVVFLAVNGLILYLWLCSYRQVTSDSELVEPLLSEAHYLSETPVPEEDGVVNVDKTGGRLFLHEAVPMHIRHLYPVVIIGALFLLVASNLSVGASVDLVRFLRQWKETVFAVTLCIQPGKHGTPRCTMQGYIRYSILVVGFSGIWPYVKLLLMLFGWCTRVLELRQRGCMLFLLDALGKFSLVDTFVLVLMMVSFRFHLVVDGLMTLDVFVNPGFGFYSFLLASTISLIAGHVILYFHRQSLVRVQSSDETRESLCRHEFDDKSGTKRRMTCFFAVAIVLIILLAVVFLSIGMTKKSFIFQVGGLAGKMLGDDRTKSYSLLTLGTSLPQSAEEPSFGMTCLQVAYFFYSVIMPFSCLAAIMVLFLWPMTYRWQTRILAVAEIANAWSAVEVFALSILASLMELSTFATFIVGDKCNVINAFLANHFDDELNGDDTCYTVTCSVASSVWFLICGAVLNSWIVSFMLKVAHHAISEQRQRQESEEDKEVLAAHDNSVASRDLVSILMQSKLLGGVLFTKPEEQDERDHTRRKLQGNAEFWKEWQEMCAVT